MKSTTLSIQLSEETAERLASIAGNLGMAPQALAERYVEEGLRMDKYPLVHFVDGPAGRRARLLGGPDVWEMISTVHGNDDDLEQAAACLEVPLVLVQAAADYYEAYRQEIDERIERNRMTTVNARLAAREASA